MRTFTYPYTLIFLYWAAAEPCFSEGKDTTLIDWSQIH